MLQQVLVAGDDGSCARGSGEGDEIVVGGIAQKRRRVSRIAELDAGAGEREHDALDVLLGNVVAEEALVQAAPDFAEESRADDGFEDAAVESGEEKARRSSRAARDS